MNSEFKRMMELAGLTEIKVNAPNWQTYSAKYKSLIDTQYADIYDIDNPQSFKEEVYNDWGIVNELAYDIAKEAGFKGSHRDIVDDEEFHNYLEFLAHSFLLQYGLEKGIISRNEPDYQKEAAKSNKWLAQYKGKFKNIRNLN